MAQARRHISSTNQENENDTHQQTVSNGESGIEDSEMIRELKREMNEQNDYLFVPCSDRNVILIGRTRTGKSTISAMIEDPFHIPQLPRLFASTRDITFNRITTTHQNKDYCFTIIDSPGLYDCVQNAGQILTNKTIKSYLDECITKDITQIHAFAFVFSSGGGINNQDIESMIYIQSQYPALKKYFMLIITHCEEKDEEERKTFINEFFQHPDVVKHSLQEFFGLGVFFTGCLRPQLKREPNLGSARIQQRNVLEMRRTLLDFLVSRKEKYNIHRDPPPNPLALNTSIILPTIAITAALGIMVSIFMK